MGIMLIPEVHKLTKEEKSKGGKKRTFKKKMINRKLCNTKCEIYYKCPVMAISQKKGIEEKHKPICELKNMPMRMQERVINLLNRGEDGLINEMKSIILEIGIYDTTTLKGKEIYTNKLKDLYEIIFGKKSRMEMSGSINTGVSVDKIREIFEKYQIKPEVTN